jgi:hypothetical protein
MPRIVIDNKDFTQYASGMDKFDIDIVENSTKTISRSISSNITLKGPAYDLINQIFFSSCSGFLIELPVSLTIDICGGTTFVGKITAEGTQIDEDKKEAKILIKGKTDEATALSKLSQDYLWENGFIESANLPAVHFTKQTSSSINLLFLRLLLGQVLLPLTILSKAIAGFVVGLCKTIDFINVFKDYKCPKFEDVDFLDNILEAYDNAMTGNGSWSPGMYVRDFINYQCKIAGINFSSSILNNPASQYYNMALWSLTAGKSGDFEDKSKSKKVDLAQSNAPLMSTVDFLESIKDGFGADYKIVNGTLHFEPIDFFNKFRTYEVENGQCNNVFEFDVFETYAYLEAYYTNDQYDMEGSKVFQKYYQTKIDFNDPPIEAQKGKKSVLLKYSPTRFMFDAETLRRDGFFDVDLAFDRFKAGISISKLLLGVNLELNNQGPKRFNDMVITSDLLSEYKLLVLDVNTDPNDAKVIRKTIPINKNFFDYNYPLHFTKDGLVPFLEKFNPRLTTRSMLQQRAEVTCNCELIEQIIQNPYSIYLNTKKGKGYPTSYKIQVDEQENKVKVIFEKIYIDCKN